MTARLILLVPLVASIGCTAPINAPPSRYGVQGNYEDIASCLYRSAEDTHTYGRDVHLTRLTNPPEVRVAQSNTTSRSGVSSLAWEVELLPAGPSSTRFRVRQASTLVNSQPFWSTVLEPMIARCAGSKPVPE